MKLLTIILTLLLGYQNFADASSKILPYSVQAFKEAQQTNKIILVQFHASWCGTCRRQHDSLTIMAQKSNFIPNVIFEVNFDNQLEFRNSLGISRQSTLVLFQGPKEISRSTGLSKIPEIEDFLKLGRQP